MDSLDRLRQLERQVLWMRRIGAVALAVIAAVFMIGQGKDKEPQDLVVRSLMIVSKDGKALAELSADKRGYGQLKLHDVEGKPRLVVGYRWVNQTFFQPSVLLFDREQRLRGHLGLSVGESAGLWFHGKDRSLRVALAEDLPILKLSNGPSTFCARGGAKGRTFTAAIVRDGQPLWEVPKRD